MTKKLTPKQNRFVQEYLIDLNATQAAIRAGYSERTARSQGQRLLTNVDIQEAIQEAIKLREQRTAITADYVLLGLKKIYERCAQGVPVMDREGNPTGEYRFDAAGANKALELLGKHLKLFTEKREYSGGLEIGSKVPTEMTTAEIEAELAALEREIAELKGESKQAHRPGRGDSDRPENSLSGGG